jgi:ubiquitin conjugation factor E4 B
VRFVNLMINDVTYLMDESLSELAQIHNIETEMENTEEWGAKSPQYRREREGTLRSLERHASGYITLGRSTVDLLQVFTAETKSPFMMPEIVGKLAAMLDYNLEALAGPKCRDLKVKDPEKYKFDPKVLLCDIVQVFLNLSGEDAFAMAVAEDGRSYKKELFERTADILDRKSFKSRDEIEKLMAFVQKVEDLKAVLEEEEDMGEVPDEYLGSYISGIHVGRGYSIPNGRSANLRCPVVHHHEGSCDLAIIACRRG